MAKKPSKKQQQIEKELAEEVAPSLTTYQDCIQLASDTTLAIVDNHLDANTGEAIVRCASYVAKMIQMRDKMDPNWNAANSFSVAIGWEQARSLTAQQAREILQKRNFAVMEQIKMLPGVTEAAEVVTVHPISEVEILPAEAPKIQSVVETKQETPKVTHERLDDVREKMREIIKRKRSAV